MSRKPFLLAPRLLRAHEARRYLGGRDPRSLMAPTLKGEPEVWDHRALDAQLDKISGVLPRTTDVPSPSTIDDCDDEIAATRAALRSRRQR